MGLFAPLALAALLAQSKVPPAAVQDVADSADAAPSTPTVVSLAELHESGPLTLTVTSSGCFHHEVRRYRLQGHAVSIDEQERQLADDGTAHTRWRRLGSLTISRADVLGLDRWVQHVAAERQGCTTSTTLDIAGQDGGTFASYTMHDCSVLGDDVVRLGDLAERLVPAPGSSGRAAP